MDQTLASSTLCTPQSNNIFLINKKYMSRAKPMSIITNNDLRISPEASSEEFGNTKDTISESIMSPMSPENKTGSGNLSGQLTPSKSILKSAKIGSPTRKTGGFFSSMQSFFNSSLRQEEPKSLQTTPKKKFLRIAHVRTPSFMSMSPVKPSEAKRVTFAARLESHKILDYSDNNIVSPVYEDGLQLKKSVNNFFDFSQEFSTNFIQEHGSQEASRPIFNLTNRPTEAASNIKLPLVLSSSKNGPNCERVSVVSYDNERRTDRANEKRATSLPSRKGRRGAVFVFNVFH